MVEICVGVIEHNTFLPSKQSFRRFKLYSKLSILCVLSRNIGSNILRQLFSTCHTPAALQSFVRCNTSNIQ